MIENPLWQLSKKSLDAIQNAKEVSVYLSANQIDSTRKQHINPKQFYIRLSVLLIILQLQNVESSQWCLGYFLVKCFYLFQVQDKKYHIRDFIILICLYLTFPKILAFIPFSNLIYWFIAILYFFGGVTEKYLILQLLLINSLGVVNFFILIALGLANIKKRIKYPRIIVACDMMLLGYVGKIDYMIAVLTILVIISIICQLDGKLIHHKKKYSHLFEIEQLEQYH